MRSFPSIAKEALTSAGLDWRSAPVGRGLRIVNKAWRQREADSAQLWPYRDTAEGAISAMRRYHAKGGCTDSLYEYAAALEAEASRIVNK